MVLTFGQVRWGYMPSWPNRFSWNHAWVQLLEQWASIFFSPQIGQLVFIRVHAQLSQVLARYHKHCRRELASFTSLMSLELATEVSML